MMSDDKGSSSSNSCDPKSILRAASLDSAEAALVIAAAPLMLQRQTHHSPPGAFAMSTSTFGGGIVRRSRTYSDETDRSTLSSRDVSDSPIVHRVPVAELVQPTFLPEVVSSSSLSLDRDEAVNTTGISRQRIWDLEIAQEVYGGVVAKANDNEEITSGSQGQRRLWVRAFFLACVMVFLLLAAVGTTRSVEHKRKGPVVQLESSNSNHTTFNNTELEQYEHEESLEAAALLAETTSSGTFILCPNQNTTHVHEDLRRTICDVADVWEDELETQTNDSSIDLTTLWPVSCPANVTMMVCTTIRNLICTSLQTGLLPTDPWNHTSSATSSTSPAAMGTTDNDYSVVVPRTVTNPSTSSSSSDHGST
jgi:hypothetical protein